jgi:hypothetical protein
MKARTATVASVHAGVEGELGKAHKLSIEVALDGVVGDRHRSFARTTWSGDKQPEGTVRRNERQWSAVSVEELEQIRSALDLAEALRAADLGANLCLEGINGLSGLPKGTRLKFPSGAELIVEEYNPPCLEMGKSIAARYCKRTGEMLSDTAFSQAAKLMRGLVGVVDVPGTISAGDTVRIEVYAAPGLARQVG